jgi:hypothetical protein
MKRFMIILFFCSLFVEAAGACISIPILNNNDIMPHGGLLYQDDFSNLRSGWQTKGDERGSLIAYQVGGLRLRVNDVQTDLWAKPGRKFSDARIEVDAVKIGGPNNNHFGILCHFQDPLNYVAFLISSDGYSGIVRVKEGQFSVQGQGSMEYSPAIAQGEAQNHLRADCTDQDLSLWANGVKILETQNTDFTSGEVGLAAGSYDIPGVDIYFDNFAVYKP